MLRAQKIKICAGRFGIQCVCFLLILFGSGFSQEPITLKEAYRDAFQIGTALRRDIIMGEDSASLAIVKEQFNSLTAENAMKFRSLQPKEGEYTFEVADSMVSFADRNGMFVIGHTLVWHAQTSRWVFKNDSGGTVSRDVLIKRMRDHIHTVVGHFKGKVHGWDVLNEAVDEEGELRRTRWMRVIGPEYVELAFQFAHEADPETELYYNDYNMYNKEKVKGVIRLVKNLQSKGIRIDGVGFQGHWALDFPELDEIEASIQAMAEIGMKVMITEMDVDVLPQPGGYRGADISKNFELKKELDPYSEALPDSMQQKLADRYAGYFRLFYQYKDIVTRVTLWGVDDGHSWKNFFPVRGRTNYPLLFDRQLKPKPAFDAVIAVPSETK